ncbi:MAG: hypothetical protein Fur0032_15220 [Terrimicrobiaceae bacterium]
MNAAQMEGAAKIFSSLSEPTRLCLLKALMDGPMTVGQLVGQTGMKQGNVSKHLGLLVDAGLLGRERDGNFVRYSVRDPLVYQLCELVCDKVRRDAMDRIAS